MAVNTFLNFFLTLLMSSPFQYLLPQCSLVAVKIRLSTCPGRELESDLSRTTCINSPGSSHCPAGVPRWFLWGALRMFWYTDCTFVVTGKGNWQIWGCTVPITVLQKWLRSNKERHFVFAMEGGVWRRCWHCEEQLLSFQTPMEKLLVLRWCAVITCMSPYSHVTWEHLKFLIFHNSHLKHQNQIM